MQQLLIKDIIDFKKVGYKNIRLFLRFLFGNDMYEHYINNFASNFNNTDKILFAEDLHPHDPYEIWLKYLRSNNPTYTEDNWKNVVLEMMTINPRARMYHDTENNLHVSIPKEEIQSFTNVMISGEVGRYLKYDENNETIDLYLKKS